MLWGSAVPQLSHDIFEVTLDVSETIRNQLALLYWTQPPPTYLEEFLASGQNSIRQSRKTSWFPQTFGSISMWKQAHENFTLVPIRRIANTICSLTLPAFPCLRDTRCTQRIAAPLRGHTPHEINAKK